MFHLWLSNRYTDKTVYGVHYNMTGYAIWPSLHLSFPVHIFASWNIVTRNCNSLNLISRQCFWWETNRVDSAYRRSTTYGVTANNEQSSVFFCRAVIDLGEPWVSLIADWRGVTVTVSSSSAAIRSAVHPQSFTPPPRSHYDQLRLDREKCLLFPLRYIPIFHLIFIRFDTIFFQLPLNGDGGNWWHVFRFWRS